MGFFFVPNTIGNASKVVTWENPTYDNALKLYTFTNALIVGGDGGTCVWGQICLNMRWANTLYGNSNTIQPNSIRTMYIIRYEK